MVRNGDVRMEILQVPFVFDAPLVVEEMNLDEFLHSFCLPDDTKTR